MEVRSYQRIIEISIAKAELLTSANSRRPALELVKGHVNPGLVELMKRMFDSFAPNQGPHIANLTTSGPKQL